MNNLRDLELIYPGVKATLLRLQTRLLEMYPPEQAEQLRNTAVHKACVAFRTAHQRGDELHYQLIAFVNELVEYIGDRAIVETSLANHLRKVVDSETLDPDPEAGRGPHGDSEY